MRFTPLQLVGVAGAIEEMERHPEKWTTGNRGLDRHGAWSEPTKRTTCKRCALGWIELAVFRHLREQGKTPKHARDVASRTSIDLNHLFPEQDPNSQCLWRRNDTADGVGDVIEALKKFLKWGRKK
jgi:hypothetical protein